MRTNKNKKLNGGGVAAAGRRTVLVGGSIFVITSRPKKTRRCTEAGEGLVLLNIVMAYIVVAYIVMALYKYYSSMVLNRYDSIWPI